jgi:hypothetical protein
MAARALSSRPALNLQHNYWMYSAQSGDLSCRTAWRAAASPDPLCGRCRPQASRDPAQGVEVSLPQVPGDVPAGGLPGHVMYTPPSRCGRRTERSRRRSTKRGCFLAVPPEFHSRQDQTEAIRRVLHGDLTPGWLHTHSVLVRSAFSAHYTNGTAPVVARSPT